MLARSIASFAIAASETIFSLVNFFKPFANCVVIEKNTACMVCLSRKTPYSSGRVPFLYILSVFFRTMSDNVAKQMKGFERKLPSRRRHLSLAGAAIVRHKSGISLSSSGLTTSD